MPPVPSGIAALLFDMDGVLTRTAEVHRAAWKQAFDAVLVPRGLPEFTNRDYEDHVDGKPRENGVRDFLASREIDVPEGPEDAPAGIDSVNAIATAKNELLLEILERDGVGVYEGSVDFARKAHAAGFKMAIVTSSANAKTALASAGIADLFSERVDGVTIKAEGLSGKPAPDSFLRAAELLGEPPERCAVFEDAQSGVAAGRAGGFGWVVGVDRAGQREALAAKGADVVVDDLDELEVGA